jgi:dTDP-4-amino-4,6-dideoxygalactose transaminase
MEMTSTIPLVDLSAQDRRIRGRVMDAVERVIASTNFILGPEVSQFEEAFAGYLGTKGVVGVSSGTAALELALRACDIGPGAEVITVAHTFAATVEAILNAGAQPVLVDIDDATFNMLPAALEEAITARTRAVIPVHLYGCPAPMEEILAICRPRGIRVLEDAAQAHGATIGERRTGSIGDLGCFSFYPGKNLGAYGDAGAVSGSDQTLLDRVRMLRNHGRSDKYVHQEVGRCDRLDEIQAAILNVKLDLLEEWTGERRRNAERYSALLAPMGPDHLPAEPAGTRHVYHLYVVRVHDRDGVAGDLRDAGISTGVHYPLPMHLQPGLKDVCRVSGSLHETERAAAEVLSLPMYPELTAEQIEHVADTLLASIERTQ